MSALERRATGLGKDEMAAWVQTWDPPAKSKKIQ
jgi:hypothetical protein